MSYEELKKLVGTTVKLFPFPSDEGNLWWLYYNHSMSRIINTVSPYVEVMGVEDYKTHYELICKFDGWERRYVLPEWIDMGKVYHLFI